MGMEPAARDFYSTMRDLKWTAAEKAIARRAFDRVLQQELDAAIESTKRRAAKIREGSELWELERHLMQLRKEIDQKYAYKYNTVLLLFADLVREGTVNIDELRGFAEEKLAHIRRYAGRSAA